MTARARIPLRARPTGRPVRLGPRANLAQFCLLVAVNALVGGTLGQERTVVPLLATQVFHLPGYRYGRKWLIAAGMWVQAAAIALVAAGTTFTTWAFAAAALGAGTAMVYPTLLAVIGDVAHPAWRARAVGVYRLWRDGGFAAGALLAGVLADAFGLLPRSGPSPRSPPPLASSSPSGCMRPGTATSTTPPPAHRPDRRAAKPTGPVSRFRPSAARGPR